MRLFYQRLDFGDVEVGKSGAVQEVRLYNQGTAPLAITSLAASGAGFAQANDCGGRVLAGANCAIRATFAPTAVGGQTGTLTITHDGPGSPHTIALSGTQGTAAAVSGRRVGRLDAGRRPTTARRLGGG